MDRNMYWSESTKGFYDPDVHGRFPEDAVEISRSTYAILLAGEATGLKLIAADEHGMPVLVDTPIPDQVVPESVTMMQARLALLNSGRLSEVEAFINSMDGADGEAARIQWQYATEVRRDWPLVAILAQQLGLIDEQLDHLFVAASLIR